MIKNAAESRRIAEALNRGRITFEEKMMVQRAVLASDSIEHLDPVIRALIEKAER